MFNSSLFGIFGKKGKEDDSPPTEALPAESLNTRSLYPSLNPTEDGNAPSSLPYLLVPENIEVQSSSPPALPKVNENSNPLQSIPVSLIAELETDHLGSFNFELKNFTSILFAIMERDKRQDYDYDFSLEKRIINEEIQSNSIPE